MSDYNYIISYYAEAGDGICCIDKDDVVASAEYAHDFLVANGFALENENAEDAPFWRQYAMGDTVAEVGRADPIDFPINPAYINPTFNYF